MPRPGGIKELCELTGHLVAIPLDRSRPLWEVWLIDGLEGGHVAALSKVHHAAIDGASGEELLVAILDTTPEIEEKPAPDEPWTPDHVPSDTEMMGYALGLVGADTRPRGEDRAPHGRSGSAHAREQPQGTERQAAAVTVQRATHVVQRRAHTRIGPSRLHRCRCPM